MHTTVDHEHLGVVGAPHWALSPARTVATLAHGANISP